jgi:hypothetical protein
LGIHGVSNLNFHELMELSQFISYILKLMNHHGHDMDEVVMMALVECFLEELSKVQACTHSM